MPPTVSRQSTQTRTAQAHRNTQRLPASAHALTLTPERRKIHPAALQATEYDPGVFVDGYKLFASMQCDSATGLWRFWNSNGNDWTVKGIDASGNETVTIPTYSCSILNQKGSWHHYQLYVTMDFTAHKIAYKSFAVDGTVVYQNLGNTYNALSLSGDATINIEQQLDSRVGAAAFTNSEYLDNYNLWVW